MIGNDGIIKNIQEKAVKIKRPLCFMELCGTHSQAIAENSLKEILPKNIRLLSGPGCPICVTDQEDVDLVLELANAGIPIAAYGDAVALPGSVSSLEKARQNGADINIVYSVTDALEIKKTKPNLVFWGIGFETTAPMTAWGIKRGLLVFSSHKLFPPAIGLLLKNKKRKIDGLIDPGHVSAIIGTKEYEKFNIPQVISGFEREDILCSIDKLLDQILKNDFRVENEYSRVVKEGGNPKALKQIFEVFDIEKAKWRGLGTIPLSGLGIKKKYQKHDARVIYENILKNRKKIIPPKSACRCGLVLQGEIEPENCPLFRKICSPQNPQGACMVSVEGACNVDYKYHNGKKKKN